MIGKFKDKDSLQNAYENLEREFTIKSQQLREFQRKIVNGTLKEIPEGAVVLTREEYEKLKHFENRVRSGVCFTQKEWFDFCNKDSNRRTCLRIEERKQIRKETAEKFARLVEFHSVSTMQDGIEYFTISALGLKEILHEEFGIPYYETCEEITEKGVQNGN